MGWLSSLFGGSNAGGVGNKQTASTTSSNTTTTYNNTDKRAVADNGAIAVTGDGNSTYALDDRDVFNSLSLSSWTDNADRSTNTYNVDTSNRSTYNVDTSNRSTNSYQIDTSNRSTTTTNLTMTDQGAMNTALAMMREAAITDRQSIVAGQATMDRVFSGAFDTVTSATGAMQHSVSDALGFGRDAFDFAAGAREAIEAANGRVADAYKDAAAKVAAAAGSAQAAVVGAYSQNADTQSGNRPLVIAGMIVAGVVALSVLKGK